MKTLNIFLLLMVCLITFTGCASYHFHATAIMENSNQSTGGGLFRVFDGGTVEPLKNGAAVNLPTSGGALSLRYDAINHKGGHVAGIDWLVDKQHKDTNTPNVFIYGNPGDGTHIISCVITWAWAGDNQYAGCDTINITVKTYRDSW